MSEPKSVADAYYKLRAAAAKADQLVWDQFAASAPVPPTGSNTGVSWDAAELASMAAAYADALMLERAKRVKP